MGGVEGVWVRYWDEASTAAVLEFTVEEPTQPTSAPVVKEKKEKKAKDSVEDAEEPRLPVGVGKKEKKGKGAAKVVMFEDKVAEVEVEAKAGTKGSATRSIKTLASP